MKERKAIFAICVKTQTKDIFGEFHVNVVGSLTEDVIRQVKERWCKDLLAERLTECVPDQCVILNVIFLEA